MQASGRTVLSFRHYVESCMWWPSRSRPNAAPILNGSRMRGGSVGADAKAYPRRSSPASARCRATASAGRVAAVVGPRRTQARQPFGGVRAGWRRRPASGTARSASPARGTVVPDGLVHEGRVVVGVEAEQREEQHSPHLIQHLGHQHLFAYQQRRAFRPA